MTAKVALITGGAQGIGKGIAAFFLEQNIQVIIIDHDKAAGKETEKELNPFGAVQFIHANVGEEKDIKEIVRMINKDYGRLDCLINNAGIMVRKPISQLTLKEWNKVINVNLTGAFLCAKHTAPSLKKSQGCIINIASTRAFMSEPNTEAYSASKGGIFALTHALAISLGPRIRVNCISPGWIEVSEWKKKAHRHSPNFTAADCAQHPAGRVGKPQDVASLVWYLLSDQARFITGANFFVDGGMTRKMIYV